MDHNTLFSEIPDMTCMRSVWEGRGEWEDHQRRTGAAAADEKTDERTDSPFDLAVGHYRRYRRTSLVNRLAAAGFKIVDVQYRNRPGAVLWYGWARVLRRNPTGNGTASLFDKVMVPLARASDKRHTAPFGQSIVAVGEKPAS